MIERVLRWFGFGLGYVLITVGILCTLFILYGTKPLQLLEISQSSIAYSLVLPVVRTGVQGLIPSILSLLIGLFIFRSSIKKLTPRAIFQFPIIVFRIAKRFRNWFLEKVDYLQSESEKWKRVFQVLRSPYSFLRMLGFSPQFAASFLIAGSAVTTGVAVNEALEGRSFARGDSGIYAAPSDAPVFYDEEFNTLRVDLGTTSVGLIEVSDTTLGTAYANSTLPSNETNVIIVGGLPASSNPTFNETYLIAGTIILDRLRCQTLTIEHSKVNKLIVRGNSSDGQSISSVPSSGIDVRMRGVNGGNRADDMISTDSYFDQLKINSAASGVNSAVDVLKLSNIYSRGGGCLVSRVLAGTMEVTLNEIGGDSDLATKDFQIKDTVLYKSFTNDSNYEIVTADPAVIP